MARDLQEVTAGSEAGTAAEYIQLEGGGRGIMPFAKMVFSGSFTLDGSGVGDTADLRLTLPLPSTNVWQLQQFAFNTEGTTAYTIGRFTIGYAPSTIDFGESTILSFPLLASSSTSPHLVSADTPWVLAASTIDTGGAALGSALKVDDPFRLVTFNDVNSTADPIIWIGTPGTNAAAGTVRFAVSFLGYSFEQMNRAELHTGFANRG